MNKTKPKQHRVSYDVPETVWKKFTIRAREKGMTASAVLREFMTGWINGQNKIKKEI